MLSATRPLHSPSPSVCHTIQVTIQDMSTMPRYTAYMYALFALHRAGTLHTSSTCVPKAHTGAYHRIFIGLWETPMSPFKAKIVQREGEGREG